MPKLKRPRALDIFSGCGGLTQGLRDAGFDVIAAIENDKKSAETYRLNHPSVNLFFDDIRNICAEKVLSAFNLLPGELDLIAGCPPCQGFSRMRRRNRGYSVADPRNTLIEEFGRLVSALKPRSVLMENVPGLFHYDGYKIFKETLASLDYQFSDAILDAVDYNTSQRRKRLILLAAQSSKASIAKPLISERKTVRQAIGNLPKAGESGDDLHDLPQRRSARIASMISSIPKDGGSRRALPVDSQLSCHRRSNGFSDVYGRMAWNRPAPTITGGCYNPSKGRFLHPSDDRAITLREAALLQGFPKDYQFNVLHGREAISLMIGNALPPPFVAAQASAILKVL